MSHTIGRHLLTSLFTAAVLMLCTSRSQAQCRNVMSQNRTQTQTSNLTGMRQNPMLTAQLNNLQMQQYAQLTALRQQQIYAMLLAQQQQQDAVLAALRQQQLNALLIQQQQQQMQNPQANQLRAALLGR